MDINALTEWNPWWENKEHISQLRGQLRTKYELLINSIELKEITILLGIRRAGKSTIMYQMIDSILNKGVEPKQILFVNFDDPKLTNQTLDAIYNSYRINLNPDKKAYLFFDEIHKKHNWESWVKKKYDLKTNDKFIISGSCAYLLKKEYATLLTGRNLTFEVYPLSFEEFLSFKNTHIEREKIIKSVILERTKINILKHFQEYLLFGGFPEVCLKQKLYKTKLLEQYFDDILYKDIISRHTLNAQKAKDLALFLISNITHLISLRTIRTALSISYDTAKDFISYYKEAFLLFTIDHFSYSFKEQKTRASKLYCIDNGLRNATAFTFSKDEGKLAENLVFIELKRRHKELYYWAKKGEVDFVVKNNDQTLTAINVSYTDELNEREITALLELQQEFKTKIGQLILLTKDTEKKDRNIRFIP
ncbi:ATP-binding protein, partial [Candidatus Woesearchaeota archaeon]|nr:ATP-binding protein [Candidatus Woesearchaeota archaeon]